MSSKQASVRSLCAYQPRLSKATPSIVLVIAVTINMSHHGKRDRQTSLAASSSAGHAMVSAKQMFSNAVYMPPNATHQARVALNASPACVCWAGISPMNSTEVTKENVRRVVSQGSGRRLQVCLRDFHRFCSERMFEMRVAFR